MPPSQGSGSSSEGRLSGASARYIDSDMVGNGEKRSRTRSDHRREGNTWDGVTDLYIEVGDRSFCLHKFPSISKSGKLNRFVNAKKDRIVLPDFPGGSRAFEFVARFLYGQEVELTPGNVAAIRYAAEYLEMTGDGNLVTKAEDYLSYCVLDSWRDCITVLKSCSELSPWAEDLQIVRRCTGAIASKCSRISSRSSKAPRDWWFDDVCSLSIDYFSKVIRSVTGKGLALVPAAVQYYAEKWLQLTRGSDMSTTLKLTKSEEGASYQDIVAKDATHAQHKNRAVLQGIVNLLPPQLDSMPVKFLLKLLRVACLVNAGSLCKTDLANRIGVRLENVSVDDLLIPASGESMYDVDIVLQIVEFYVQEQSYGDSPPFSPRSSVSGSSMSGTTSRTSSLSSSPRSLSSASSSDLSRSLSGSSLSGSSITSGSSVTTDRSGRRVSGSSDSGSSSDISRSSSDLSSRSSSSFRSTSDSDTTESSDTSSSSSGLSSVKLEKKPGLYAPTESPRNQRSQLPRTVANFTVAQLLETYLDEIAKDSSICLEKFITLAELFTGFPRDSDDSIYRAVDGFLRAHPSMTETERRKLCRVMDTGALSLAASVHAASNERLPLRVIVQLLFSEQVKLRNGIAGNDMINEKDLGGQLPSFSSTTTSSSESSSDATSTSTSTTTSSSTSTSSTATRSRTPSAKSRTPSISSASEVNLAIAKSPSAASVVSSQLLGGLSVKETLRFVLAEIETLRKSVQEIETVKSHLSLVDTLQQEMQHLSTKFLEISHDYIEMTHQVEELTKSSSKNTKSGWTSGWKKVAKSFQSKDNQEQTPPLAPLKVLQTPDVSPLPTLKTSKSGTLHPTTPRAGATLMTKTGRADSLPVTITDSALSSKIPRADSFPIPKTANIAEMCPRTPRADLNPVIVKKDLIIETMTPRESIKITQVTPKSETPSSNSTRRKEDYNITGQRSHHVEDVHRRSVRSRSTSPDYTRPPRHLKDADSVSVTSTSSYSSYSTTSSRSGHRYRARGSHGSLDKKHSRAHHKPERRRQVQENHGPTQRKHRQKEGSHHSGQKDHVSLDSHPRHSGSPSYHHRHKEGSIASRDGSEHYRSGHRYKEFSKESHPKHHSKKKFSASEGSIGSGRRRRHCS